MTQCRSALRKGRVYMRFRFLRYLTLAGCVFWGGCASTISGSVTKPVNTFGKATASIMDVSPGKFIREYTKILTNGNLAQMQALKKPENVLCLMVSTAQTRVRLGKAAAEADKSVAVLQRYSAVLVSLATTDFRESLLPAATALGTNLSALDAALSSEESASSRSAIFTEVSNIAYGIGSIYIEWKRSDYITDVVSNADPTVKKLVQSINKALSTIDDIRKDREQAIKSDYKLLLDSFSRSKKGGVYPRAPLQRMLDDLTNVQLTEMVIKETKSAALEYQTAHEKMVQSVKNRSELDLSSLSQYLDTLISFRSFVRAIRNVSDAPDPAAS